ncbi:MAG: alpha/beta hydrolase [Gammaproteobacteria bacterium]|nr:alpha/beta hydrolase [Gammaproteobacteria bacterium]MBV9725903.1 alpha/beta hydrolase [Gammaproteobacteria bacterium]
MCSGSIGSWCASQRRKLPRDSSVVLKPAQGERRTLPGPAGSLEALIEAPAAELSGAPAAFGVICHPHPLYGGTLDNKVVWTLARAFQQLGAPTIRFNFRGIGASTGTHDEGRGEVADALAVIAHGRQRWPQAALWLGGFSFGGVVALRAAATAGPACLVTIAPGITKSDVSAVPRPACPWLIVQGEADDVVPAQLVTAWAHRLSPAPELLILPGAGHYFHGRINELRDTLVEFMRRTFPAP